MAYFLSACDIFSYTYLAVSLFCSFAFTAAPYITIEMEIKLETYISFSFLLVNDSERAK